LQTTVIKVYCKQHARTRQLPEEVGGGAHGAGGGRREGGEGEVAVEEGAEARAGEVRVRDLEGRAHAVKLGGVQLLRGQIDERLEKKE
jgi:hypothetical protein